MKENSKIYKKNCPSCGKEQIYKNEISLKRGLKNNIKCGSCSQKGKRVGCKNHNFGKKMSAEQKEKLRLANIGKKHSEETKRKMSKTRRGRKLTEEHKLKLSLSKRGKNNPFYGKKHTKESKEKNRISNTGRTHSIETKRKIRKGNIDYVEQVLLNGGQISPSYNINSISILEQKAKELGINDLQHAENGGEFYIKELGYWVDGYSKEKNVVIEYYEKHHEKQIEKDLERQKEIEDFLKCQFIIIKE